MSEWNLHRSNRDAVCLPSIKNLSLRPGSYFGACLLWFLYSRFLLLAWIMMFSNYASSVHWRLSSHTDILPPIRKCISQGSVLELARRQWPKLFGMTLNFVVHVTVWMSYFFFVLEKVQRFCSRLHRSPTTYLYTYVIQFLLDSSENYTENWACPLFQSWVTKCSSFYFCRF